MKDEWNLVVSNIGIKFRLSSNGMQQNNSVQRVHKSLPKVTVDEWRIGYTNDVNTLYSEIVKCMPGLSAK